jgi:hypothetical protein
MIPSGENVMTIDGQIALKKSEADEVWADYQEALQALDSNDAEGRRIRETDFKGIRNEQARDLVQLALLRALENAEDGLRSKVRELALSCDRVGNELDALQQQRATESQQAENSK